MFLSLLGGLALRAPQHPHPVFLLDPFLLPPPPRPRTLVGGFIFDASCGAGAAVVCSVPSSSGPSPRCAPASLVLCVYLPESEAGGGERLECGAGREEPCDRARKFCFPSTPGQRARTRFRDLGPLSPNRRGASGSRQLSQEALSQEALGKARTARSTARGTNSVPPSAAPSPHDSHSARMFRQGAGGGERGMGKGKAPGRPWPAPRAAAPEPLPSWLFPPPLPAL